MGDSRESLAAYWDEAYRSRGFTAVSWFQSAPTVSLELIEVLGVDKTEAVIDIGGGSSPLVDHLVRAGFEDVTVLDVSEAALESARQRVGETGAVTWLHGDLLRWQPTRSYTLWHDRAVFHFLTAQADRDQYLLTLNEAMASGGAVVMATFASDGPDYCSGLPVARYSPQGLSDVLGDGFRVVAERRELHTTPAGAVQPFTWVAAKAVVSRVGPAAG